MDVTAVLGLERLSFGRLSFHETDEPCVANACSEAALRAPVAW
jgi:hypothetical protein